MSHAPAGPGRRHRRAVQPTRPASHRPSLDGFSDSNNRHVAYVVVVFTASVIGWAIAGYLGLAVAAALTAVVAAVPWRGLPLWTWVMLRWRGQRSITWSEPITVANNQSGGGVRIEEV